MGLRAQVPCGYLGFSLPKVGSLISLGKVVVVVACFGAGPSPKSPLLPKMEVVLLLPLLVGTLRRDFPQFGGTWAGT